MQSKQEKTIFENIDVQFSYGAYKINVIHIAFIYNSKSWFVPKHRHSGYEIHYIPSGYGKLNTSLSKIDIKPNDIYLIGPNVEHEQISDVENPMSEIGINFEIIYNNKKAHNLYDEKSKELHFLAEKLVNSSFWISHNFTKLSPLFELLHDELTNNLPGCFQNITNIISQILIILCRSIETNSSTKVNLPKKDLNSQRKSLISDYFSYEYKTATRKQLANLLKISERQLSREIAKMYPSQSFNDILTQTRISRAMDLLIQTNKSIETISEAVGFNSFGYFSKVFKIQTGISPKEFRHSHTKNK